MIIKSVNFAAKKQTSMATAKPFRFQGKATAIKNDVAGKQVKAR